MSVVSDPSANAEEKIERAAKVIRASEQNKAVFKIIYSGSKFKTIDDIKLKIPKFNTNTYKATNRLYGEDIIDKKRVDGVVYYGKKEFYTTNRDRILKLSQNFKRLKNYPTKRKLINIATKTKYFFQSKPNVKQLYIDDIDSFNKVRGIKHANENGVNRIPERIINKGICSVVNSSEKKDWGGERNDIYTNNISFRGTRVSGAFALKGKAIKGRLVPGKMGKNGDQIQRLFEATADIYFVVHNNDVDERIVDLMQSLAIAKSTILGTRKKILFCVVDGKDLARLIKAYPVAFKI
jgi:hypothetical protein